jgi:DNA (cytosine-5)-methyltransferase 1
MNERTHLDLFSGIGGFALAARWNGFRTVGFCDNEPYSQAVLKKHWPDVPVHGDIREVRGDLYAGVTLLTGGFPCQPFSVAGKQRGKRDDRYLWPEMLRVIREARPAWIIGENVAGIVNMALDQVHIDLEAEGYEVESLIVPACAVDAPHRRDRVWILANNQSRGRDSQAQQKLDGEAHQRKKGCGFNNCRKDVADAKGCGMEGGRADWKQVSQVPIGERVFGRNGSGGERKDWPVEPNVGRVAHGIPNRVAKLRGLGNAIVPQVAAEIIRCITQLEDTK